MKVKIAYTVELEDIPKEISEMLNNGVAAIEDAADVYKKAQRFVSVMEDEEVADTLKDLEFIRRKLEKVDTIVGDCQSILQGYDSALKQIKEQQQEKQDEIKDG